MQTRLEQLKRKKQDEFEACKRAAREKGAAAAEQQALAEGKSDEEESENESNANADADDDAQENGSSDDEARVEDKIFDDVQKLHMSCCAPQWCFLNMNKLVVTKFDVDKLNLALTSVTSRMGELPTSFFAEGSAVQKKKTTFFEPKDLPKELQPCVQNLMEGFQSLAGL